MYKESAYRMFITIGVITDMCIWTYVAIAIIG